VDAPGDAILNEGSGLRRAYGVSVQRVILPSEPCDTTV
jgi:hypothetical protein